MTTDELIEEARSVARGFGEIDHCVVILLSPPDNADGLRFTRVSKPVDDPEGEVAWLAWAALTRKLVAGEDVDRGTVAKLLRAAAADVEAGKELPEWHLN